MQSIYTVLASPKVSDVNGKPDSIEFVSNKFSWGAFLVPFFWFPIHGMWRAFYFFLAITLIFFMDIYLFLLGEYRTEVLFMGFFLMTFLYYIGNSFNNKIASDAINIFLLFPMLAVFAYMMYLWFDADFLGDLEFEGFAIDMSIWFIGGFLILNCYAQLANEFRIEFLQKKGWRVISSIIASSRDEAEFKYFNEQSTYSKDRDTNIGKNVIQSEPKLPLTNDIDFSSENNVIGLFPKPESLS